MKIGIDLDEVIAEFIKKFIEFYNTKTKNNLRFEDWHSYNFWDVIGGTKEKAVKLVDEFYNSDLFDNIKLVDGAQGGIEKLVESNELFVITSRPIRFKQKTDKFLRKYFLEIPIKLFYSDDFHKQHSLGKAGICVREGIEVFIEDNSKYALACLDKGVKTFLLDKPWNKGNCDGAIRVYNWDDVLKRLVG